MFDHFDIWWFVSKIVLSRDSTFNDTRDNIRTQVIADASPVGRGSLLGQMNKSVQE